MDGIGKIDIASHCVEREILNDVRKSFRAKVVADSEKVFAVDGGNALYCIADSMRELNDVADISGCFGRKKAVLFLKEEDGLCGSPLSAYAYLDAMPVLPSGGTEIKRLAPSLAQTVSDATGFSLDMVARLMRDSGIFGAIVGGKLAGFIGQTDTLGMDLFRVYESANTRAIGKELVLFLTTLVMTFGRLPFALIGKGEGDRRAVMEECGFVPGKLFAYVV